MNTTDKSLWLPNKPFKGSFRELLPLLKEFPALAESSHARLFRLIERQGENEARSIEVRRIYGRDTLTALNAFSQFHGIENPVSTVHQEYLLPAKMGAEASKQAMVLIGPPGAGKSDWTNTVKALFRSAEPVPYLHNCPIHDHPLSLLYMIPTVVTNKVDEEDVDDYAARAREVTVEILTDLGLADLIDFDNAQVRSLCAKTGFGNTLESIASLEADDMVSAIVYGLGMPKSTRNVVGAPCPYCQDKVLGQFQNPGQPVAVGDFPIRSFRFTSDFQGSGGIVDVPEVQPLNFDISAWVGAENLGLMGKVNPPDPRCVSLNGAFNKGNRGLVILTEGLKNPPEAQRILLEALQGRRVGLPAPLTGSVFFDGVIMINSNEGEYIRFMNDRVNEPYADRFWRVYFTYPLEKSQVRKVDQKLWNSSEFAGAAGVHVEPLVWDYMARLEVLSRIEDDATVPRNIKVDAYDGRDIRQNRMGTKISVQDLRARATWREGMEGMSPREVAKILNAVAGEEIGRGNCVTSAAVRDKLAAWFRVNIQDEKKRERMISFLGNELDAARRKEAQRIVLASLIEGFQDECQQTWEKYLDNIGAYLRNRTVQSRSGYSVGKVGGDEDFMRKIESDPDFGVSTAQADKFRGEVQAAVAQFIADNKVSKVPYDKVHDAVKRCIERFVLAQVRQSARLFSSASARTSEDNKKLASAKDRLIANHGFCPHCAEELLREAEEDQDFLVER